MHANQHIYDTHNNAMCVHSCLNRVRYCTYIARALKLLYKVELVIMTSILHCYLNKQVLLESYLVILTLGFVAKDKHPPEFWTH